MNLRCDAQNETELAAQLVGFFQQFLNVFSELKGKTFYLAGESVRSMCSGISLELIFFSVRWVVFAVSVSSLCVRNPFT